MSGQPDITICIKTLLRPVLLERLLKSIHGRCALPVLVADDSPAGSQSRALCERCGAAFLSLSEDVGLSAGRNALVDAVTTPAFIMLDDDFVACPGTDFAKLGQFVLSGLFDVAGGHVLHHGQPTHYEGFLALQNRTLKLTPLRHPVDGPTACDIVYNFIAGNTEKVGAVRWDDRLKICEHQAFFIRCQRAGLRVGYIPDIRINHMPEGPPAYSPYRKTRANEFFALFKELYGISGLSGSLSA